MFRERLLSAVAWCFEWTLLFGVWMLTGFFLRNHICWWLTAQGWPVSANALLELWWLAYLALGTLGALIRWLRP